MIICRKQTTKRDTASRVGTRWISVLALGHQRHHQTSGRTKEHRFQDMLGYCLGEYVALKKTKMGKKTASNQARLHSSNYKHDHSFALHVKTPSVNLVKVINSWENV